MAGKKAPKVTKKRLVLEVPQPTETMTKREYDELDQSREVCGAFKRRGGARCKARPVPGRTRCKWHGGKSLRGLAHPNWQGKGYSVSLPARYADLMNRLNENPLALGSLVQELALHTARHHELMQRLSTGEFGSAWRRLKKRLGKLRFAVADEAPDRVEDHLSTIEALTDQAIADDKTWDEITKNSRTLMQLADTERKRDEALAKIITERQWHNLLKGMAQTVVSRTEALPSRPRINGDSCQRWARACAGISTQRGRPIPRPRCDCGRWASYPSSR